MELSELAFFFQEGFTATWSMYLLKYNKKTLIYSADKVILNPEYFKDNLSDVLNEVLDKIREYQGIIPYTEGVLSDGFLSEILSDDARINTSYTKMSEAVINAGENLANKYNGYILKGVTDEGKEILMINTGNPVVSLKNMLITPGSPEFNEPLLIKLAKRCDCLILNGSIYGEPSKIEGIFGLSSTARAICEANRKMVSDSKVFCESAVAMLMNPRILRSFSVVEEASLESLKNKDEAAKNLLKYADMEYMADGTIAFMDERACKLAVKYLSGHIVEKNGECFKAGTLEPLTPINK